jgi:hypothetical protein
MKRSVSLIGLAMVLAFALSAYAESASGAEQTLTGTVTCTARVSGWYGCKKGETLQSCTLECVRQGFNYELLMSGNVPVRLEGNTSVLDRFAGGKANVTGKVIVGTNRFEVESASNPTRIQSMAQSTDSVPLSSK